MPMPASGQMGSGQLPINGAFSVAVTGVRDTALDSEVQRFTAQLSRQTGIPFYPNAGAAPKMMPKTAPSTIAFAVNSAGA